MITNVTDNVDVSRALTKKATLEWLSEQHRIMDDNAHLEFATSVYGENFPNLGFHPTVVSHSNLVAVEDRLPKMLKKKLTINGKVYIVKEDLDV